MEFDVQRKEERCGIVGCERERVNGLLKRS